ncbi:MAG TPA: hypothetical protein DCL19_03765 [Gammaproteobacteria bacterium]|nr:hypothetical protein [Gammaproteobacteria bacterium]
MAASLGGLMVNRTDNSAVESAVSMKVAESCRQHSTYLEAGFFAAPATRAKAATSTTAVSCSVS